MASVLPRASRAGGATCADLWDIANVKPGPVLLDQREWTDATAAVEEARKLVLRHEAQAESEGANFRSRPLLDDPERGRCDRSAPPGITDYWETNAAISLAPAA